MIPHADFLVELTRRRVIERYIGSSSRMFWVVLSPMIPLLLNIAVFYFIAKIPQVQTMGLAGYAAFIFSGLLPFRFFQRAATDGVDLLVANMEMLKSVRFPLQFVSMSAVGSVLVEFAVQCVLMAVLLVLAGTPLTWTIVLIPVAIAALIASALGASWLISVAGYMLRDLQEVLGVAFGILLYATPTMYPPEAVPGILQFLIRINPLTHYVVVFRDLVLPGPDGLHPLSWLIMLGLSALLLGLGYVSIHKSQRFVGDMV